MHSTIQPFNFEGHQVRTVLIDDEPWFNMTDVSGVLEITRRPAATIERLNHEDVRTTYMLAKDGKNRQQYIVNESGLYDMVLDSRKPQAKAFRRWITSEVIPSISRTGTYGVAEMSSEELMARAVLAADSKIKALEMVNQHQSAQLELAAPKVEYVDTYVDDNDCVKFSTVASTLGMKESDLRELLIKHRWIYRETTTEWSKSRQEYRNRNRYSEYSHKKGLFRRILHHENLFNGEVMHTLKITPAGAVAIARLVGRTGQIEVAA